MSNNPNDDEDEHVTSYIRAESITNRLMDAAQNRGAGTSSSSSSSSP